MGHLDGHELAVVSTWGGAFVVAHRVLPRGWMRALVHRQPIVAMSLLWATMGVTLPLVIPPIRRALKLPTNQYDAENPKVVFPKY